MSLIVSTLLLRSNLQYSKCKEINKSDYYNKSVLCLLYSSIKEYPNSGQSDLQPHHPCGYLGKQTPETLTAHTPRQPSNT